MKYWLLILIYYLTIKFSMDIHSSNIEALLKQILQQQLNHEKNGNYVEAEQCRIKYDKQKEDYHNKTMYQMNMRHKKQEDDLERAKKNEMDSFNNFWDKEMNQFNKQSEKMVEDLKKKHQNQIKNTREQLDRTLPRKVKESSELLNLRKMEEYMARQKNYVEAHQTQEKIAAYLKRQSQTWEMNRQAKLQTALNTLRGKQKTEMTNLQKRIATSRAQKNSEKKRQQEKLQLKYDNFMKDLKNLNEKQVLAFKGEFKSLGGTATASSSPAKSRASFGGSGSNFSSSK